MSTIKVEVIKINDVRTHSNADSLQLATINGWQVCVRKGEHKSGDLMVYFEQGTCLPREVADRLNVTKYLSEKTNIDGDKVLVVHRAKLRGEPSFGLAIAVENPDWRLGQDVAGHYGATKYYPPVKTTAGDAEVAHPLFPTYTDIENMRSYPDVIMDGEEVVATEKVHGTNCRIGFVRVGDKAEFMAGSKGLRRRMPDTDAAMRQNTYWYPFTVEGVKRMLMDICACAHSQAVLFGEVFGKGIQSYTYGQNAIAFRAFDLMLDGRYVDHSTFVGMCEFYGVETVPLVYRGPFSLDTIKVLSDGPSIVGGLHGREGVVVRPTVERQDAKVGRVILKYVGDNYLFGKSAEQDTTDL